MPIGPDERAQDRPMPGAPDERLRFERLLVPHLDAAYNLARWLVRRDETAKDVVQEACLRALRFFGGFHGDNARPWFLAIVRNAAYDRINEDVRGSAIDSFDEELHTDRHSDGGPDAALIRAADAAELRRGLEALPALFREALVLREFEELSYAEIAAVTAVPIGTVMSRLARARTHLKRWFRKSSRREG